MRDDFLLTVDAAVNLVLGVALLFFTKALAPVIGAPVPDNAFYASILGAVLFGIGLALLVERYRGVLGVSGLGLGGAIAINICGSLALLGWLAFGRLGLPSRGYWILGGVGIIVLAIGLVESVQTGRAR